MALVDEVAGLPAGVEALVEGEEVIELQAEEAFREAQTGPRGCCRPRGLCSRSRRRAAGAKFSERLWKPCSFAHSRACTMRKAFRPFGAASERGIVESESDREGGRRRARESRRESPRRLVR